MHTSNVYEWTGGTERERDWDYNFVWMKKEEEIIEKCKHIEE